jgi:hypothetical protein
MHKHLIIALGSAGLLVAGLAGPAQAAPRWRIQATYPGVLDVAALGKKDAWLADVYYGSPSKVRHWNGRKWRKVGLPSAFSGTAVTDLDASAKGNVWLTGFDMFGSRAARWDGKKWRVTTWKGGRNGRTYAVGAREGWYFGDVDERPDLTRHFDGKRWRRIAYPLITQGFSAASSREIWTVGEKRLRNGTRVPGVARWNGKAWRLVPFPTDLPMPEFTGVEALSATNVYVTMRSVDKAILFHWNGKKWRRVPPMQGLPQLGHGASDGSGGLWFSAKGGAVHYRNGNWRFLRQPVKRGYVNDEPSIIPIPGTRGFWATHWYWKKNELQGTVLSRYDG